MAKYRQQAKPVGGFYPETKVYYDGSHYIAIPHTERPYKPRRRAPDEPLILNDESPPSVSSENQTQDSSAPAEKADALMVDNSITPPNMPQITQKPEVKMTKKQLFEQLYKELIFVKFTERRKKIIEAMLPYFKDEESAAEYVDRNLERKKRNLICRRIRMTRKANLANFNYFCTFTYDDKKHTEASFKKKLKNKLSLLAYRQGWKYMGVWERSPEKQRLHFHGLFNIPEGKMVGTVERHDDYSVRLKRVQTTYQNTYFNERFGRSDFETIDDKSKLGEALAYLMKYIEKSEERIVYSKGLPQFFISDIMDDDVICSIGLEDNKLLLFDDFVCWDEGTKMGAVSEDTIRLMRKSN